jgi:GrpB-like predicted nucleotidyltransferase (UPF0157 family)
MLEAYTNAESTPNDQSQAQTAMTEEQIQAANVGGAAPRTEPIKIADYDPEWPLHFENEATRLQATLGERVLLLEHVGSTSVPGLAAKPKID